MATLTRALATTEPTIASSPAARPRLGFLGVGWIGRHRMEVVVAGDLADVVAVADAAPSAVAESLQRVPAAKGGDSLEFLLEQQLDGIVIATPSALHARQVMASLDHGAAVFCQKPLARTVSETRCILEAAAKANRLLGVDFSYRFVDGVSQMRELVQQRALGEIYAVDLVFHNAYGPDKPWFYDPLLSGGGCLIDLGTHLADLALWILGPAQIDSMTSRLFKQGRAVSDPTVEVEDYAVAQWNFETGATARLACSWRLPAGTDCVIEASFYGTEGAVSLRNRNGSFYDFTVERLTGTNRTLLAAPDSSWGGRAILNWVDTLASGKSFRGEAEHLHGLANLIDAMYHR